MRERATLRNQSESEMRAAGIPAVARRPVSGLVSERWFLERIAFPRFGSNRSERRSGVVDTL
jgi:hypothetical protein